MAPRVFTTANTPVVNDIHTTTFTPLVGVETYKFEVIGARGERSVGDLVVGQKTPLNNLLRKGSSEAELAKNL
jgi:hypothetical protein